MFVNEAVTKIRFSFPLLESRQFIIEKFVQNIGCSAAKLEYDEYTFICKYRSLRMLASCVITRFVHCISLHRQNKRLTSLPSFSSLWRRYCCLTSFFSDCRYVPWLRRYSPTKLCDGAQMAIFGDFFASCIFQRAACSRFQTCILNSH